MKTLFFLFLGISFSFVSWGQELRVHLQANEYFPLSTSNKEYYPFLWYDDRDDLGFLFGGFGVGASYRLPFKQNERLEHQAKLMFHRFRTFGEPILLRDVNAAPLGAFSGVTTEYAANLSYVLRYKLNPWLSLGGGVGASVLLFSSTDYGDAIVNGEMEELKPRNRHYHPVVPVIPIEIGVTRGRWSLDWRTEFGLLNRVKDNTLEAERFILSAFELGYLLNGSDGE